MKTFTAEQVLAELNIPTEDVICVYPYGSRIYGHFSEKSDYDWVVVYKSAFLPNGAFRNNAISSPDRLHQAISYSRTGYLNAIDTYDITALECAFLPESLALMEKMRMRVRKWVPKEMVAAIITKASASWHQANECYQKLYGERSKKNAYHSLRILGFGLQMKEHQKIVDYSEYNWLRDEIEAIPADDFNPGVYLATRDQMMTKLRL